MPNVVRGSDIVSLLFADNAANTLGITAGAKHSDRVNKCHRAYIELVARCAETTQLPQVRAVCTFLSDAPLERLRLDDDFDPTARITFRVNGVLPTELKPVQEFWAAECSQPQKQNKSSSKLVMQCLICGQRRPVLLHLPAKIKGIPKAQPSGTTLTAAKGSAFESYGMQEAATCPVCQPCAELYVRGLNELLRDEATHVNINQTSYVFWTRQPTVFSLRDFLTKPQPEQVKALIESVHRGRQAADVKDDTFYCAALGAHGGRALVRDWIDTTLTRVREMLAHYFEAQGIVGPWGEPPHSFAVSVLASSTVRILKDLSPTATDSLIRCALTGSPLPPSLLFAALRRVQVEQEVPPARAALIKLFIRSRDGATEDKMVSLDLDNHEPAYLCGRLLAVLERAQTLAVPGADQRWLPAVMRSPAAALPRLLARARVAHLAKLQRDKPGAYYALAETIDTIVGDTCAFPKILNTEQQAQFTLGYYHQRAFDRSRAKASAGDNAEDVQSETKEQEEQIALTK
jgi:CRISPR-associated protein Csd1